MKFVYVLVCVAALGAALGVQAADPRQKADYERRLSSVSSLTQALKLDPKANTPAVKSTLGQVAARQKEAEELAAAGEYEMAKTILDEGYASLTKTLAQAKSGSGYEGPTGSMSGMSGMSGSGMGGMAGADGKPLSLAKKKADFERELMSARSMLDATRRSDAQAGGKNSREVSEIEALIAKAASAAGRDDLDTADKLIDEALTRERALITLTSGSKPSSSGGSASAADDTEARAKKLREFDSRMSSARAMVPALESMNKTKSSGRDASIAEMKQKLDRAQSMRDTDPAAGLALIEQASATQRSDFQAMAGKSTTKSGSAAMDNPDHDMTGMTGDEKMRAIASQLRTGKTLRDAYERKCAEKGIDGSATLARIDKLMAEARAQEGVDSSKALQAADEAFNLAKSSLASARASN